MATSFDVVVIGGGHNGLVAATYLARAGQRVLVLERRATTGGAAATEELWPGYRISPAAYAAGMLDAGVARELDLASHGLKVIPIDPAVFAPHPDGRHLMLWRDTARAQAEIKKFSEKDAQKYGELAALLGRLTEALRPLIGVTPPAIALPSMAEAWEFLKIGNGVRQLGRDDLHQLMRMAPMAVADLVGEYFETELLRAVVAAGGIWGVPMGPWSAGTTATLLYQLVCRGGGPVRHAGVPVGGMGALSAALAGAAKQAGVLIRTGAEVARIDVAERGAAGVTLACGESIPTRAVMSNADPKRTFLKLLAPERILPSFAAAANSIRTAGCVARVNLALSELPDFSCLPGKEVGPQHRALIHIGPEVDYLERAFDDSKYGRASTKPYLEVLIPSVVDPSVAPSGRHVMSIFMQHAPYKRREGTWAELREQLGDRIVDTLAAYAPNLKSSILHRQVLTPVDLEEQYGLTGGCITHADMALDQLFLMRPAAGFGRYRAPIAGLYLCGAGTHPGGGVTGLPGANAARELLRDLRTRVV